MLAYLKQVRYDQDQGLKDNNNNETRKAQLTQRGTRNSSACLKNQCNKI